MTYRLTAQGVTRTYYSLWMAYKVIQELDEQGIPFTLTSSKN